MDKTIELLKEISEILLNNTCDNCEDYHSWSENPYSTSRSKPCNFCEIKEVKVKLENLKDDTEEIKE